MLEPSSVFYKLQAQLSTWDCKYILLENERQFLVYCSGCRGHPDAFQSDADKHSSNICQVEACLWWPRCAGMGGCIWPGWRPFFPLTCSVTLWVPDPINVATCLECIDRSRYMPLTVLVQYLHLYWVLLWLYLLVYLLVRFLWCQYGSVAIQNRHFCCTYLHDL